MAIRQVQFTNTLTRKKEVLKTREPGKVSFYSCGPTVWGSIHIGNLRAALVADLVNRVLKRAGYDVCFVRNYTDVDDKIIERGKKEGKTALEVADFYLKEVEKDYAVAALLEPTHKCRVTETIPEIITMIEKIIAKGHAYVIDTGEVLFSVASFPNYGKLSHKKLEDLTAGIRVEVNEKKKNPMDFSLWKPAKPDEPFWDSPWGKGRPGWHIECSAMSGKWIGAQMDIHHGGEDLMFPHHENEIAQSEAASGLEPYTGIWLHNAFLTMSKTKMSKSLGNVVTARDFLVRYGTEVARMFCIGSHYRSIIDLEESSIEHTLASLQRIYVVKKVAAELAVKRMTVADPRSEAAWGIFLAEVDPCRARIDECYFNDLNTAGALAELFTLIRSFNRVLGEPRAAATAAAALAAQQLLAVIEQDIGSVIGVGRLMPEKGLAEIDRIKREMAVSGGKERPEAAEIEQQIAARIAARVAKDFAEGDRIRKDLEARGVVLKDSPAGTTWSYK